MKSLKLKKIFLLSIAEKSARMVSFDPEVTLITGENDTGKSSLIKSIYYTFGAPVEFDAAWKALDVASLIQFELASRNYTLLRYGGSFLLKEGDEILFLGSKVSKLSLALNQVLDFYLPAEDKSKEVRALYSYYYALPFYIDQDRGWGVIFDSFGVLRQFTDWKRNLLDYVIGLKPKAYYEVQSEISSLKTKIQRLQSEMTVVNQAHQRVKSGFGEGALSLHAGDHAINLSSFLEACAELRDQESSYRDAYTTLQNRLHAVSRQIEIVKVALAEIEKDRNYAVKLSHQGSIECPLCHTEFSNEMSSRFSIADDEVECRRYLLELNNERLSIVDDVEKQKTSYLEIKHKLVEVERLMAAPVEGGVLKDVIRAEAKREVRVVFDTRLKRLSSEIATADEELNELKKKGKSFQDRGRKAAIDGMFRNSFSHALIQLNVQQLDLTKGKGIPLNLPSATTGSVRPRAIIAYYYSLWKTITENGNGCLMPLIIDSPNQHDLDAENLPKVMKYALREKPKGAQLILGSVGAYGAEVGDDGREVKLKGRRSLLDREEYDEVLKIVLPAINQLTGN